jgi:hypothetical protein
MPRRIRLTGLLALPVLAALLLLPFDYRNRSEAPSADAELPPSGAMQALDFWAAARAYPNRVIPEVGMAAAWEETRQAAARIRSSGIDAGVAPWTSLGPTNIGGRTLALALLPGNPDVIFAGSASGGLWKTVTGGVGPDAWDRIETGFPVTAVSTIATDPGDPDVMYMPPGGTITSSPIKCDWMSRNRLPVAGIRRFRVLLPVDLGYAYQGSDGGEFVRTTRGSYGIGLLKSTDGGLTWTMSIDWRSAQTRGVWAVRIHPVDSNRLFAATTEGIYRSTNAGSTWELVLDRILATDLRIHPVSPDTILAACGNFGSVGHGIYRSLDGGTSWAQATVGLPGSWTGKTQLDIAPTSPDVAYASIADTFAGRGLYRSTDAGGTWSLVNSTDYPQYQGWYSHYVRVSPFDVDFLYAGGIEIWRSTNGGASLSERSEWQQVYFGTPPPEGPYGGPQYAHADHHAAEPHPTDADIFFFASDGGVFKTTDGGDTFVGLNGGYTTTQFYNGFSTSVSDSAFAMGGMQDNFTAIWEGSPAWRRVIGGDGAWTAIHSIDPDILWGGYQYLGIQISFNNGNNWQGYTPPRPGGEATAFIAPYVMAPSDPEIVYAGRTRVYKSTSTGGGWTATNGNVPLDGSNPALSMAISATSTDTVYAGTVPASGRARVHRTTNGGTSWTDITGGLPDRYPMDLAVDPTDSRIAYVVLSGFGESHLWRTSNAGITWNDIGASLPDVPATAVAVDPDYPAIIYFGNDLGVWVSPDAGTTWEPFDAGMPPALVNDLKVYAAGRKLRVATHGNGAWERPLADGSVVGVEVALADVPADLRLAVSPNPVRPGTRITFELPVDSPIRLTLHDVAGRRVATLIDESRSAGAHSEPLALRGLTAGVYFARLEAGRDVTVTRVIYVH